jgi:hypothetical protein
MGAAAETSPYTREASYGGVRGRQFTFASLTSVGCAGRALPDAVVFERVAQQLGGGGDDAVE